jgi:ComF family protein
MIIIAHNRLLNEINMLRNTTLNKNIRKLGRLALDILYPPPPEIAFLERLSISTLKTCSPATLPPDKNVSVLLSYKDPIVKGLIWALKYKKSIKISRKFGKILADSILEDMADLVSFDGVSKISVIPIPISKSKLETRGYNQSELLCQEICRACPHFFQLETNVLIKRIETKSQARTVSKKERLENIKGSFVVKNLPQNRSVIIIDDVYTTGATLEEARRVLKKSGVKVHKCYAIAH